MNRLPAGERPPGWGATVLHLIIVVLLLLALGYTVKRYQSILGDPNHPHYVR